ncbi:protein of unknown function [Bradyrhizobium vignae]|uniref:Uncharacterized protein n=1 Tax=Bradyrhizobium vignae TaxID=1549949 RepID=A0A2U3Q2L5_9BRAD|nr:protein of unknown function [Bradyrhizobium vignae]
MGNPLLVPKHGPGQPYPKTEPKLKPLLPKWRERENSPALPSRAVRLDCDGTKKICRSATHLRECLTSNMRASR